MCVIYKKATLEFNSPGHTQPVESVSQQRSYVLITSTVINEPGSNVEYRLDAVQLILR